MVYLNPLAVNGLESLVHELELKDPYTRGHSARVASWAAATAREFGLNRETIRQIEIGGHLHDLGKIGIEGALLNRAGPLTRDEYDEVMRHTELGCEILAPWLDDAPIALEIVRFHHERYDGCGRPARLRGAAIPLAARIVAVADAFDVMTTGRPYRDSGRVMEPRAALSELRRNARTQFDPLVVRAFCVFALGNATPAPHVLAHQH